MGCASSFPSERKTLPSNSHFWLKVSVLLIVGTNTIVLPVLWYTGIHPDFNTVRYFGRLLALGENVYSGGNPYAPSSMIFWIPFGFLSREVGWLVWKLLAAFVCVFALKVAFDFLAKRVSSFYSWLCLLNLGVLAGFTAKSGNPGNIAAPLAFASCLLSCEGKSIGGVLLGFALAIKYPLALPCVFFLLLARRVRPALVSMSVFLGLNIAGMFWLAIHGADLGKIPQSITSGVVRVGGYDEEGFSAHFAAGTRGKYSTLAAVALWNTAGLSRSNAQMLSLFLLCMAGITSAFLAWTKKQAWVAMAVFGPAFLTFTYHRYYDSALVGFSLVLAWLCLGQRPRFSFVVPATIIASSVFLIRSLAYNLVYRLNVWQDFLDGIVYNFVLGPAHIYSLLIMSVLGCVLAVQYDDPERRSR